MPDKGLVREIDILEKLYTKCYNESKGRSINPFRNGLNDESIGRIQTLLRESVKFLNFRKLLWSSDSPNKVGPMLKI